MADSLGLYVSIPFCKAKCSFCNFASGVFAADRMQGYVDRLCEEIEGVREDANRLGADLPVNVDSIYFGGGTPSLLEPAMVQQIFRAVRGSFELDPAAEITVECAPGQVSERTLHALQREEMNRLSFGVQSFVDREGATVGRLHSGAETLAELRRMQEAGVDRLALDLICGLPGQTEESWRYTVEQALASGVDHVSLYMLEVDDGSRLGREKLAGGQRYGAAELPGDDRVADWYALGCDWLESAGIRQYEISNFARAGQQSRHNRKYWEREPYIGVGLDAHSMLREGLGGVRFSNTEEMGEYVGLIGARGFSREVTRVDSVAAFEESLFLGLRLVDGVSLAELRASFGALLDGVDFSEMAEAGLVACEGDRARLTGRGRMVSNEVFGRLLVEVCG